MRDDAQLYRKSPSASLEKSTRSVPSVSNTSKASSILSMSIAAESKSLVNWSRKGASGFSGCPARNFSATATSGALGWFSETQVANSNNFMRLVVGGVDAYLDVSSLFGFRVCLTF